MNNVSIIFLILFVAVCSAARFPFQARAKSHCADCSGLFKDCFCADLDDCAEFGCSDIGECSRATCSMKRKREPNDCPDCAGFGPGCGCENYEICKSEGCSTGECTASNCDERKRSFDEFLSRRTPNDCPDCAGFGPGCGCENYEICKSEGCSTGECTASNCGERKRSFDEFLSRRTPNDCPDCAGFGPGCGCENYELCKREGCSTGECTASNCGDKKRSFVDFLIDQDEGCADCPGFGSGCPCADALHCLEHCGTAGECTSTNCS